MMQLSLHSFLALLVALFAIEPLAAAEPVVLSTIGSERATTGPGNNIVTHGEKTHVVWQDAEAKGYVNRVRSLDHASGEWSPAVTLGPGVDNHARPAIAVDADGFLHVVLSGHNTMNFYRRSVRPNDSSEWTKPQPIDIGTYPMLVVSPGGDVVVTSRPKPHDGVNLYMLAKGEPSWQTRKLVLRRNEKYGNYGAYNVSMAWSNDGVLHLTTDVYVGRPAAKYRGEHQAVVYMQTRDLGQTWSKADGTTLGAQVEQSEPDVLAEVKLPAGQGTAAHLRNGGVVVDSHGRPFVYFTERVDGVGRPRLVTFIDGQWKQLPLAAAFQSKWPDRQVLGARGHLSLGADDALYVLTEFAAVPPPGKQPDRFEQKYGVGLLTSRDGGQTFAAREILPIDESHHYTQANLERPTNVAHLGNRAPAILVTDGEQRYPKKGEVIQNRVLFVQPPFDPQ